MAQANRDGDGALTFKSKLSLGSYLQGGVFLGEHLIKMSSPERTEGKMRSLEITDPGVGRRRDAGLMAGSGRACQRGPSCQISPEANKAQTRGTAEPR